MGKIRSHFSCQQCGHIAQKWLGRCPECDSWNSFVEESEKPDVGNKARVSFGSGRPELLQSVSPEGGRRLDLGMGELNRVLGGGLTRSSVCLVAGSPGIGKSTLLLQVLRGVAKTAGGPHLYISGEESSAQIRLRAQRLGEIGDNLYILPETDLRAILKAMEELKPEIVVVDSVQTMHWPDLASIPGNVSQVREVADRLVRYAKQRESSIFLVGHVTKDGTVAGPMTLEHLVDTVLFFEGDSTHTFRLLRATKNRFGPTDEIGVFEMTASGLKEVENPSELFLRTRPRHAPGSVVFCGMEGTRPVLLEIQALATKSSYGVPLRNAVGFDKNRLAMLLAVLEKRGGMFISDQDVYVNVVGGMEVDEPAADLAVLSAVISSMCGKVFPSSALAFGEVGLAGETRPVPNSDPRLREAAKLKFSEALVPTSTESGAKGVDLRRIENVAGLIELLR